MAKGKKRKPAKNSNYQINQADRKRNTGSYSTSNIEYQKDWEGKKKKRSVSSLFALFAIIFLLYFVFEQFTNSEEVAANLAQYLLPGVVCALVSLVLHLKHL